VTTLTLQPDATDGIDTFIDSGLPDTNYATGVTCQVGERSAAANIYRQLIKFDLSALPADAIISSAVLSLYATLDRSTNARTFRVYRLKRAWVEAEATWNIYSTGNNWSTAGGFHADDCEQVEIGSRAFTATETINVFKDFPLTPTTKAGLDLGNGWLIKADTEVDDNYSFASSDNATASNRPKLVIEYTVPGGGDTIEISSPVQYQTYQRDGSGQADITISGTYTGTPTAIEASFNGGAYATIDASPGGGAYSGALTGQAAGQGTLTVRFTNDTAIDATVADIGIGDVYVVAGQSNAEGRATNARSYTHATLKATVFKQSDAWANGNDPTDTGTSSGSPWPLLATLLMADQSVPVAFITTATGGTKLYGGTWTKNGTEYADCVQTIANSGVNGVKAVLWHQGENDANDGVTAVQYAAALSAMLDNLQTDTGFTGMKLICANLGFKTTGSVTRANLDAIRLGQLAAVASDADILAGPVLYDVDLGDAGGDGVHFATDTEMQTLADRWWRLIEYHFYSGSDAPAYAVASVVRAGATVAVTFSGGVSPLTGQTGTTGWRFTDNGTPIAVSSAAASGSNAVILTLASTPAGTELLSFGSGNDAAGATLLDSGTYPLPPEPFVDHAVTFSSSIPVIMATYRRRRV